MVAAIQTHGELLHWHPHFHVLLTCGAFTPQGEFLELPELDLERLQTAWQEAVFALYLAATMSTWCPRSSRKWWRTCAPGRTAVSASTSRCSGEMKVIAFIEPPQNDVIEKILRHCGLWCPAAPRAPPTGDLRVHDPDGDWDVDSTSQEPQELTFVDEATFWSTF